MADISIEYSGKVTQGAHAFLNSGTALVGEVDIDFKELVKVFGKPNCESDGYKTDAQWVIYTPAGIATIYNYKDGINYINYLGQDGLPVEDITNWHIGGHSRRVLWWVEKALGIKPTPFGGD